jgi:tryptophanyl-tRNA synthetase
MSKSDNNDLSCIYLTDDSATIRKKIQQARTDDEKYVSKILDKSVGVTFRGSRWSPKLAANICLP